MQEISFENILMKVLSEKRDMRITDGINNTAIMIDIQLHHWEIRTRDSSVGRAVDCRKKSANPSVVGSIPTREIFE